MVEKIEAKFTPLEATVVIKALELLHSFLLFENPTKPDQQLLRRQHLGAVNQALTKVGYPGNVETK